MTALILIKEQLKKLGLDQRDLARGAEVTESYVSQLMNQRRPLPAPDRTDIYEKMERVLELPAGRLSLMVTLQRQETVLRELGEEIVPLFPQIRELVLRKCVPSCKSAVLNIFEKQAFGEIERLITQIMLDVSKQLVTAHQDDDHWLRATLHSPKTGLKGLRAEALAFIETDIARLSQRTSLLFLESLIATWDIDLVEFEIHVTLNAEEEDRPSRRFHFAEKPFKEGTTPEPGFIEFLGEDALSGTATDDEIEFLGGLRFTTGRPTRMYYYRELQSVRDPLHIQPYASPPPGKGRSKTASP